MEKVRPWCCQPSDRGRLKNRTELSHQCRALHRGIKKWTIVRRQGGAFGCGHWTASKIRGMPGRGRETSKTRKEMSDDTCEGERCNACVVKVLRWQCHVFHVKTDRQTDRHAQSHTSHVSRLSPPTAPLPLSPVSPHTTIYIAAAQNLVTAGHRTRHECVHLAVCKTPWCCPAVTIYADVRRRLAMKSVHVKYPWICMYSALSRTTRF